MLIDTRRLKLSIDNKINDMLLATKPNYDDSLTGMNEAWSAVTSVIARLTATAKRWRHVKRGTTYIIVGHGTLQIATKTKDRAAIEKFIEAWDGLPIGAYDAYVVQRWINSQEMRDAVSELRFVAAQAEPELDGRDIVIYQSTADDSINARLTNEFMDGRFVEVTE